MYGRKYQKGTFKRELFHLLKISYMVSYSITRNHIDNNNYKFPRKKPIFIIHPCMLRTYFSIHETQLPSLSNKPITLLINYTNINFVRVAADCTN